MSESKRLCTTAFSEIVEENISSFSLDLNHEQRLKSASEIMAHAVTRKLHKKSRDNNVLATLKKPFYYSEKHLI